MSWNGSGTFSRIHDWVTDKGNAIGIVATRHDAEDDSFAAGIQACVTKNGESKFTAACSPNADASYSLGSATLKWVNAFLSGAIKFVGTTQTTTVGFTDPTADRAITFPDAAGIVSVDGVGANIASATTVDLTAATGNLVHITGTTATTAFTMTAGQQATLVADAAWPLTYNATTMKLNGGASQTLAAGDRLYVFYDGTTTFVNIVRHSTPTAVQDFRLTLTTATPVTTADVTGATTMYLTPYKGNNIALYNGSAWGIISSAEVSLALGTLTAAKPYDVFAYDNAGVVTLEFLVWTDATNRATALAYQDGVLVKSGATTRRYLGTFYTTSTTETEDSILKRNVWNYYNRVDRFMKRNESTASWTYTTATWRQANGAAANQIEAVIGVAEDAVEIDSLCSVASASAGIQASVGIGIDSTSTNSAITGGGATGGSSTPNNTVSKYMGTPAAGWHKYVWLEFSTATGTTTWNAFSGVFLAGIVGKVKS